jgi:cysteine desulfurase
MKMKLPVYLDYHAAMPCDPAVIEEMLPYFSEDKFGNSHAVSSKTGRDAAQALSGAMEKIAALIGAGAASITLTSGATEANNIALLGVAAASKDRNEIVISALEHSSIREAAAHLEKQGYVVRTIPVTEDGFVEPDVVADLANDKTMLVSTMLVSNEIGTIQPVEKIAAIAHNVGALFHCDATQAAGKLPVNIDEIGADLLSMSSHKIYGPQGVGALYVRQKPPVKIEAIGFGGGRQPLRPGTVPLALAVGFGKACEVAQKRREEDMQHLQNLSDLMLARLEENGAGFKINGAGQNRIAGSLNLFFEGADAEGLLLELADDIAVSTGAACASASNKPSPVLKAIGLSDIEINSSVRISFGRNTTREEIIFAADRISSVLKLAIAA